MDPVHVARLAVVAVCACFAARTFLGRRRDRVPGPGLLVAAFGLLAAAAALVQVAGLQPSGGSVQQALVRLALTAATGYAVLLVGFVHRIAAVPRLLRISVAAGGVVVAALVLSGAALPAGSIRGDLTRLDADTFGLFVLVWLVGHAAAVWRLWGHAQPPSLVRRRMRLSALGFVVLAALPLLARSSEAGLLPVQLLAVLAVAGLWVAIVPPARVMSLHTPVEQVHSFEMSIVREAEPSWLLMRLSQLLGEMIGTSQVWVLRDGEIAWCQGIDPDEAAVLSAQLPAPERRTRRVPLSQQDWLVIVPFEMDRLVARSDVFTPLIAARTVEVIERLAGLAAVAVDRAATQMMRRHARQRAEEIAKMKDDFLSTVSHELRTPVTVIRGVVELLRRDPDHLRELRPELMDRLGDNVQDLTNVLEAFERLASLSAGPDLQVLDRFELQAAIRAAIRLVEHDHPDRTFQHTVADVTLHQDRAGLTRMLVELLSNAAKHTADTDPIQIGAYVEHGDVIIEVTDNGPGMSPEERANAFEPFYRAGNVLTRGTRGCGVGLTIVRELVKQLGGSCRLDTHDNGTTATVRMPPVHHQAAALELASRPSEAGTPTPSRSDAQRSARARPPASVTTSGAEIGRPFEV